MEAALQSAETLVEPAPLIEELRSSFYRVGQALSASLNLDETLRLIADAAAASLRAQASTVHLADGDGSRLSLKVAAGAAGDALAGFQAAGGEALTEETVRHRQPIQVADLSAEPRLEEAAGKPGALRAYLGVPLLLRGQAMGVLAVGRREAGAFSTSEVELLSSFASQSAVAIENSRLFSSLQDRLREMAGLHEVSLAFGALPGLEETYGQLVERIAGLLDVERCAILLPDETGDTLAAQSQAFGLASEQVESLRLPLAEDNASSRVWHSLRPYLTNAAQADPRNVHRFAMAFDDRSLLIVPMVVGGHPIGLLRASNKRSGRFTNSDVRLLTIFATQAAVVLRNAMLYREVLAERRRLQAIFDNASDGIVIINQQHRIVAFNSAMEALTGWKPSEAIGTRCSEVYRSHDEKGLSLCQIACPMLHLSRGGEPLPYVETIITTRAGQERDVAVSYSPIAVDGDGGSVQVVAIYRDISRAKEVERSKTQFVSTVSHELRTPLASIKASTGVLLASMPADTSEPIMRLLRNIDRSTQRLESMVADLLDLARLQSGRVRLSRRRLDMYEVVSEAASTIRPLADEKHQRLSVPTTRRPWMVHGDRQRLVQVLLNLLSNAHKYTPEGGQIEVRLSSAHGEVECRVEDNGPGIAVDELGRIFERFYRPDNGATASSVGTGLGLPIARALVELHGGRLWVTSEPGRGSVFGFTVPTEPDSTEEQ